MNPKTIETLQACLVELQAEERHLTLTIAAIEDLLLGYAPDSPPRTPSSTEATQLIASGSVALAGRDTVAEQLAEGDALRGQSPSAVNWIHIADAAKKIGIGVSGLTFRCRKTYAKAGQAEKRRVAGVSGRAQWYIRSDADPKLAAANLHKARPRFSDDALPINPARQSASDPTPVPAPTFRKAS